MAFPVEPLPDQDPQRFLIQDCALRHPIIPLFEFHAETGLASGRGTAFRVDPFGQYLTAQHVLEHRFLPRNGRGAIAGILNPSAGYGRIPLSRTHFATIAHATAFRSPSADPILDQLIQYDRARIQIDCLLLAFDPANPRVHENRAFLPLRLTGKWPKKGDRVMAIGFPTAPSFEDENVDVAVFSEEMCGSVATVTELLPSGREHRPWPTIAVDVHWPSGMSGGPVFNEDGEVIGLVSSSDEPGSEGAQSYAFWFAPFRGFSRWLPHVDISNPGWVRGWAVLRNSPWHLAAMFSNQEQAENFRREHMNEHYEVRLGSTKAGTDDFINA